MTNPRINRLLEKLDIHPRDFKLISQAFIHRSYLNESKEKLESNERLEFLGDAVLSFIISSLIFKKRVQDAEGDLTNLRSYIVKTKSLAEAAEKLNLGEYLLLSKGEELGGGRQNVQLLANTYEALTGAIFLDQGVSAVERFIGSTLLPLFAKEIEKGPPKDAKSLLQEVIQEKTKESPHYRILKTSGPDHAKKFLVGAFMGGKEIGRGEGDSKQEAEEKAATEALQQLNK